MLIPESVVLRSTKHGSAMDLQGCRRLYSRFKALGVGFKDPGVRSKFLALEVANNDTTSILYMRLLSMKEWVTSSVL